MRCESGNVRGTTAGDAEFSPQIVAARAKALELFALAARGGTPKQILAVFENKPRRAYQALHPDKFAALGSQDQKLVDVALAVFTTALHSFEHPEDEGYALTFKNARNAAAKLASWAAEYVDSMRPEPTAIAVRKSSDRIIVTSALPVADSVAASAVNRSPAMNCYNARAATAMYEATMNLGRRPTSTFSVYA